MRCAAILLLLVGCASAQSTQPAPTLPTSWVGVRATYGADLSGSIDYAQLVSGTAGLYSFTSHDFNRIKTKPYITDVTSTGAAILLRQFGDCSKGWCLVSFALGQLGAAVSSTSTTAAYNAGGSFMVRLATTKWTVGGGYKYTTAGTTNTRAYSLQIGRILK